MDQIKKSASIAKPLLKADDNSSSILKKRKFCELDPRSDDEDVLDGAERNAEAAGREQPELLRPQNLW